MLTCSERTAQETSNGTSEDISAPSFMRFADDLPAHWIDEALANTGVHTQRRRRLPLESVPWLLIGMALMRERPITEVASSLNLARPERGRPTVAPSTLVKARDRLGESPMAYLFIQSSEAWAHPSAQSDGWRGLAIYAIDGTTLHVPDSSENRSHFGASITQSSEQASYPAVRMVALMAVRSHLLAAVSFGPYNKHELAYAEDLWPCVPDASLVVVDRAYWSANILIPLHRDGINRHWLTRAKSNLQRRILRRLGPNDFLIQVDVSYQARRRAPSLPPRWTVRLITYQQKGFRPQALLTSLCDASRYPADEIVRLYHERWEIELGYNNLKTRLLATKPLRSRSVDRVRQELWGVLIAHNLVRLEMLRLAAQARLPPLRISFVAVYRFISNAWLCSGLAAPEAAAHHLYELRANIHLFILPPRRTYRCYPRTVKVKQSPYRKNRRPPQPAVPAPS